MDTSFFNNMEEESSAQDESLVISHPDSGLTDEDMFLGDHEDNENAQYDLHEYSSAPTTLQQHDRDCEPRSPFSPLLRSWQSHELSLLPCRKVSVVVKVKGVPTKPCLFPLLPPSGSVMETNDLVAVNPRAFGKYIPAQVTMDTARLVAHVVSHTTTNEDTTATHCLNMIHYRPTLNRKIGHDDTSWIKFFGQVLTKVRIQHYGNWHVVWPMMPY